MVKIKFSQKEAAMIWIGIILGACLSYLGGVSANLSLVIFDPPDVIKYVIVAAGNTAWSEAIA